MSRFARWSDLRAGPSGVGGGYTDSSAQADPLNRRGIVEVGVVRSSQRCLGTALRDVQRMCRKWEVVLLTAYGKME